MNNPMNDLWQAQQEAATRMTESWSTLLQPAVGRTARPPAPSEADEPAQELVEADSVDATDSDPADTGEVADPLPAALDAIKAMQALGDGQRDFAEHMARWAELQRDLADVMTAWASRQRDSADALDRVLAPFSPGPVERSS